MRRYQFFQVILMLSILQLNLAPMLVFAQFMSVTGRSRGESIFQPSQISNFSDYLSSEENPLPTHFNLYRPTSLLEGGKSVSDQRSSSLVSKDKDDDYVKNVSEDEAENESEEDDVSSSSTSSSTAVDHVLEKSETSLMPTNFSHPKHFKKPKVVLTLSLRSKEKLDGKGPPYKNKNPFLFGGNVIKYDTRTNRLIIPTTALYPDLGENQAIQEVSASASSLKPFITSEEGGQDSSSEELNGPALISVITEGPLVEVQNQTLRALKILEKLRSLTTSKLKSPPKPVKKESEPFYGFKKYENLHPRLNALKKEAESAQASTPVASTSSDDASAVLEYTTLTSKVGGHIKQNVSQASPLETSSSTTLPQSVSSPSSEKFYSTTPIVLKVGKFAINSKFQNHTPTVATSSSSPPLTYSNPPNATISSPEQIKTGETRVAVTADQIGGNRPTQRPFHYGPSTLPPSTTTIVSRNRYNPRENINIAKSPHNHAYAPTQDPVSIVHNEDLSVEDFQDFRIANLVFGSKVGADVPSPPSAPRPPLQPSRPQQPKRNQNYDHNDLDLTQEDFSDELYEDDRPALPVRLLQENPQKRSQVIIKTPKTTTTTTTTTSTTRRPVFLPERRRPGGAVGTGIENINGQNNHRIPPNTLEASSGVKNSKILAQNDRDLPFYKEPGGVFKEHQSPSNNPFRPDFDDDSNFISHNTFNENRPGVKYAPKRPQAQAEPQTVYANHISGNAPPQNHYSSAAAASPIQPQHHQHHQLHHHQQQQFVTQAPLYIQQHHHHQPPAQMVHVIPSPTPQVVVQHLAQRTPSQPAQPIFYHHAQQPALVAHVLPTQPLYQPQPAAPPTGFVPILHPQTTYPAAPVQPQYHLNSYTPNLRQNLHGGGNAVRRDDRGNFPHRNDPHSDTFFGDPTPDTDGSSKKSGNKQRPKPSKSNNDYEGNQDNSFRNQRGRYPPPPTPPLQQRPQPNERRYPSGRPSSDDDYDRRDDNFNNRDRGLGGTGNNNNHKNKNNNENRNNDEYDPEAEADIPDEDHQTNFYDDAPGQNRDRHHNGERGSNNNNKNREKPFRPSPQDFGPIRPSQLDPEYVGDVGVRFEHPNLHYPKPQNDDLGEERERGHKNRDDFNQGPGYDPRGFGVGLGPGPRGNVQLDPIYTRTIKQYDEENKRRPSPGRRNKPQERDEPEHDDEEEEEEKTPRRQNNHRPSDGGRRREQHRQEDPEEEEEHEEEEDTRDNRRRPAPPRRNQDDEEEEEEEEEEEAPRGPQRRPQKNNDEEEEEEEEESRNPPPKTNKQTDDEEEEEEEEENEEEEEEEPQEKPPRNRQRNPQRNGNRKQPKKKPKPPPNEKSGDLEEDIQQIDREFGGLFAGQTGNNLHLQTPSGVVIVPTASGAAQASTETITTFNLHTGQKVNLQNNKNNSNNSTSSPIVKGHPKSIQQVLEKSPSQINKSTTIPHNYNRSKFMTPDRNLENHRIINLPISSSTENTISEVILDL